MAEIHILDHETIDKIAAGEVVERPASIVKELVENAIDAGASAITVEIKDGGLSMIRISDNGCGIEKSEIRKAFLRHATSKIVRAEDLSSVATLGFRGEALSSIAAVSQLEMVTKTANDMTGIRVEMEGAQELDFSEVGAPDGTTIIVRNLFFNVPVRRKFLKQPTTEASYVSDLMEHLALSHAEISFQFIQNKTVRFSTAGNGDLKQVIYTLYGRETVKEVLPVETTADGLHLRGFLGKAVLNRANRTFEQYFVNGRYIKSKIIAKAIEDGYHSYLMQHRYPFCILFLDMDPGAVDVNVHPTKMDVRFSDSVRVYNFLQENIHKTLFQTEMIAEIAVNPAEDTREKPLATMPFMREQAKTEAVTSVKIDAVSKGEEVRAAVPAAATAPAPAAMSANATAAATAPAKKFTSKDFFISFDDEEDESDEAHEANAPAQQTPFVPISEPAEERIDAATFVAEDTPAYQTDSVEEMSVIESAEQMSFEVPNILSAENRPNYQVIGQVFDTFWLILFEDKLLMVDQHAAHEKVMYEKLMARYQSGQVLSQQLMPPVVMTLTGKEKTLLEEHMDTFTELGFSIEEFGGMEIAVRSAPVDLYGQSIYEMFIEVLDELSQVGGYKGKTILDRIATMSCKAAVKGNTAMKQPEMEALLDQLLTLENPYFCPHGRPTMIYFTKQDLEKKFKRIV